MTKSKEFNDGEIRAKERHNGKKELLKLPLRRGGDMKKSLLIRKISSLYMVV